MIAPAASRPADEMIEQAILLHLLTAAFGTNRR
jgi:hypothetical protein